MHRAIDSSQIVRHIIDTASETSCVVCGKGLAICQHRDRYIWRLEGLVHHRARDKRCPRRACEGHGTLYRPPVDLRLALPRKSFGLDVILEVGRRHLDQQQSLSRIGRDLTSQGVPIHQTHLGELLRDFVVLSRLSLGDEAAVHKKLREQGGIYLMVDGVQFDEKSPVLYLCWDARSGTPLFGERLMRRDVDAVSQMLRRVRRMGVVVRGITTDGERGLVPAVQRVFPEVPYQLCQTHFLFNCAEPLEPDLQKLGASVEQRADKVRALNKSLEARGRARVRSVQAPTAVSPPQAAVTAPEAALSEPELAQALCEAALLQARVSGKAPLSPRQLVRHQRLEQVRQTVNQARKKKAFRDARAHALARPPR